MTKTFSEKRKNFFADFYEFFFANKNFFLKIMASILSPIFLLLFSIGKSLEVSADNGILLPLVTITMFLAISVAYGTLIYVVFLALSRVF